MMAFNRSYALKQACITKKGGFGGGGSPPPPPPFANTMLASWVSIVHMLWKSGLMGVCHFFSCICFKTSLDGLKKRGGWGRGGSPSIGKCGQPPNLQTQCSHDGFQYDLKKTLHNKKGGRVGRAHPLPISNTMLASWASVVHML